MTAGLSSLGILTEKGGYLFRSASDGAVFHLGIIPCLNQGERNYHYQIHLPEKLEYFLTGSINTEGVFSVLFNPKSRELSDEMTAAYLENYKDLANLLISLGYDGTGELDTVTRMLLKDSGLFADPPDTLFQILKG